MRVLVACEFSGVVREAFLAKAQPHFGAVKEYSEKGGE
jgi:hypothetical protein